MLIFQCIVGFQSRSIDFKSSFAQADITSGYPVFIGIPRDLNINGVQGDVVIRLNKSLYGQAEDARLSPVVQWAKGRLVLILQCI